MNKFKTYLILILSIIIFSFHCGCFNKVNKHKSFINMLLEFYPGYNIEIIENDPNSLIINITK